MDGRNFYAERIPRSGEHFCRDCFFRRHSTAADAEGFDFCQRQHARQQPPRLKPTMPYSTPCTATPSSLYVLTRRRKTSAIHFAGTRDQREGQRQFAAAFQPRKVSVRNCILRPNANTHVDALRDNAFEDRPVVQNGDSDEYLFSSHIVISK